ncbi:S8 family peptidase [Bdellovibrionota bacterium FG-2]
MRKIFAQARVLLLLLSIVSFQLQSAQAATSIQKGKARVDGEFIVKMRSHAVGPQAMGAMLIALEKKLGANSVVDARTLKTDSSLKVVRLAKDQDVSRAMQFLESDGAVQYTEPNYLYYALDDGVPGTVPSLPLGAPNDPDFIKTWGLSNTGQTDSAGQVGLAGSDINVIPLWLKGITGAKRTLVAIIDTGIDWTHPDLVGNLYTNPGEIAGNGLDDDGNGFIDDVHGWNFADKTANSSDDNKHGSHCAGTIGASGNNGVGVAGVNWEVTMLPVKFLTASGSGTLEAAVESINYARLMKVQVMSNSWGGGGFSETMKDSIVAARDAGILFVAAAGNDSSNNDTTPSYPASYEVENVVSVAATDNQDKLAKFSNYGAKAVHVAAPGVKVYSTTFGGKYEALSGTSMACPHVAGISALLLSANPDWTFADVKQRLITTSTPVAGLKRKVLAKGRVNAANAYYGIIPPSDEPDPTAWKDVDQVVESVHPYANSSNITFPVQVAGAKYIRVHFEKIDVEQGYDKVTVESQLGGVESEFTGKAEGVYSEAIKGDSAVIRLKTDSIYFAWGFKVDKIQVIY